MEKQHNEPILSAAGLSLGYGTRQIVSNVQLSITPGSFTVIIGPNGCGKSTLLRALGRLLKPQGGQVMFDGADLAGLKPKQVAQRIGLLAQSPQVPDSITVADLVLRGRTPYQGLFQQFSGEDADIVHRALAAVGLTGFAHRQVQELSGGQRQRAWIALVLAQQTGVLLLDEPTTYLDISHQLEVLELCQALRGSGRTLIAVLHDLALAARYATELIAMRDGRIIASGTPQQVLTEETLREVFDLDARIIQDPETGRPLVIPRARITEPINS
ncbi:ABC transporter ATP-binding protein [Glutamicibacter sp. NPDC087344]|uniref:ABC transporter ATP-binding protein n=1 Tax=Glutamicibacter sp. NPDC087344 TaxID=3363994 RepID=UPI0037FEF441